MYRKLIEWLEDETHAWLVTYAAIVALVVYYFRLRAVL